MFDILFTEEDEVLTSAQTHFSDVFDVRQDDGDPERVVMTFDDYSSCLWNKVYCSRLAVAYACVFEFRAGAMYDV